MADEETLRPIREAIEQARVHIDSALRRLQPLEETRYLRWRCSGCGYLKHFTRPTTAEVAAPCPKCRGRNFMAAPLIEPAATPGEERPRGGMLRKSNFGVNSAAGRCGRKFMASTPRRDAAEGQF